MKQKDREEVRRMIRDKFINEFLWILFLGSLICVVIVLVYHSLILGNRFIIPDITSGRWECQEYGTCPVPACYLSEECLKWGRYFEQCEDRLERLCMICPEVEEIECECLKEVFVRNVVND